MLYVVMDSNKNCKIGVTGDMSKRLPILQTSRVVIDLISTLGYNMTVLDSRTVSISDREEDTLKWNN